MPFVLAGNGAVLDGSRGVRDRAWEHFRDDVFRFQPERMAYQQLFRDGRPVERVYLKSPLGIPPLEPVQWCLRDGYIYFRVENGRLPEDYKLSYASETVGITLYQAQHVVVSDVTVQGFQLDGVNAHDSVTDCLLTGITSRGNGRAGIAIGGSSHVELDSCLLGNNGAAQLLVQALAAVSVETSQLLPASAPAIVQQGHPRLFIDGVRQKSE
jgi:hypothetical protein